MTLVMVTVLVGSLTLSSYRSVPAQTDSSPFITSTGEHVTPGGVAVSRDLLKRWGGPLDYGDHVYIEGVGIKRINDCMAARHRNSVDVWVATFADEKAFGVRSGRVWLIHPIYRKGEGNGKQKAAGSVAKDSR